jgi:hypothetical protein
MADFPMISLSRQHTSPELPSRVAAPAAFSYVLVPRQHFLVFLCRGRHFNLRLAAHALAFLCRGRKITCFSAVTGNGRWFFCWIF